MRLRAMRAHRKTPREKATPSYRAKAMREVAADLMALAEPPLPSNTIAAGFAAMPSARAGKQAWLQPPRALSSRDHRRAAQCP